MIIIGLFYIPLEFQPNLNNWIFHLSTGYINCTSVHIISVKHLTDYAINSTANVDTPLINGRDQFYIVKKQSEFTKKLSETNITKLLEILIYA